MGMYTYELPADTQRLEQDARDMAQKEVADTYPDVYRVPEDIANHARALCEQALAATPNVTNDRQAYIDLYTDAYTRAYDVQREQMDSDQQSPGVKSGH